MKSNRRRRCAIGLLGGVFALSWGCSPATGTNSEQTCTSSIYDPVDSGQVPNTALSNVMSLVVNTDAPGSACDTACFSASNPTECFSSSSVAAQPCLYPNAPTATVTVCQHGSTTVCQTFSNLLVDTGSTGLRIFSDSLDNTGVPLVGASKSVFPSAPNPTAGLWDCVEFGDGSSEWGQVTPVDVWLGSGGPTASTPGEVASNVNIQVIQHDATGVGSSFCAPAGGYADTSPQEAGFNGILGVGLEPYDCDLTVGCQGTVPCSAEDETAGTCLASGYYQCTGSGGTSCTAANPSTNSQLVQNPVNALATDNNGVILAFTGNVAAGGAASVSGYLTLGIGTQSNNQISPKVTQYPVYPVNVDNVDNGVAGTFNTSFSTMLLAGFIDSGSNLLYFPPPTDGSLPVCADDPNGVFYCPGATTGYSAINAGANGTPSGCVDFQIANSDSLYLDASNSNSVLPNLGATTDAGIFDWGFPFFLGKSVYVGYDLASSAPYWAY